MAPVVIVGVDAPAVELAAAARSAGLEVLGAPLTPTAVLDGAWPVDSSRVLIAVRGLSRETLAMLALRCAERGVPIWLETADLPELRGVLAEVRIGDRVGVVLTAARRISRWRRTVDVVLAAGVLLVLLPLLGLLSALVKLSSPGPVLHRAVVVGQDGRPFTWYKLRTMRLAEDEQDEETWRRRRFAVFVEGGAVPTKILDTSRVTAIGRLLRRHSLDEVPQLFSVLKGDLTLIGPRPCLVYEYELLKPWHRTRFRVRPGLTGLWQVRGRGRVHADEMAFMDICYALGRTWRSDLRVLAETVGVLLTGRGAV